MSSNDYRFFPLGDQSRDIITDNRLSENGTSEIVSNCTIRRLPHFFQVEFFYSGFIRSDGGTFNTDFAFLNGFSSIKSDLIISLISVFHSEIEIEDFEIQEG